MTTPAKTATYTQCEQCGFWHTPAEPHCANCGVSFVEEYETVHDNIGSVIASDYVVGLVVAGFVGGGIVGYLIVRHNLYVDDVIGTIIGGIVGSLAGSIFGFIISRQKATRRVRKLTFVVAGLRQNEELIKQRLNEIRQNEQRIRALAQDLKRQGDPQRNHVRFQALEKGAAELSRQRDRYTGKLHEIELIRWSNQLSPLLSHSPQLNEQQTTERLNTLSNIQTQGQKLAQTWQQTPLADEETRCADRLNQALATCDQLRQDLLDLKTALAVGDISAFSKEEQRASQTALELLDTFNALPDVGGFTAGFKKLEDEYFRLQSEDDVRQLTK